MQLIDGGALKLGWKCVNPQGSVNVIYEVRRKPAGGSTLTFIGASGTRSFEDGTIPFGQNAVTYQITAVRGQSRGLPASFNVTFGTGGGGMTVTTVSEPVSGKMAA